MSWPYDYIIIGAGSAGCAIANRLAEDMALRILILEAGPPDTSFKLKMPAGFASLGENSPYNWRYETVPQKHCNDRRMYWPRGKTLGGSSSINAMLYVRGHASDYDHWRQLGNEGWSYREVLPFFKKAEHNERGASEYHGVNGPLNVTEQCDPLPINEAFFHACDERLGCKRNDDFNAAEQAGVGYFQVTQRNKERCSAASAYLKPALKRNRNNVHIVTNALVERIILDQNRAMGVRYVVGGLDEVARCSREIVLCGGAVNSPQLLMLSGIGPADHLRAHGIRPLHDLPGVGCNLQDHLSVAILQFAKSGVTYGRTNRLRALYQYVVSKKGPGTSPIAESGGFVRTHPGLHAPDLQLHFVPLLVVDQGRMQVRKDGYSLHVSNLRPESRGTIRLKSKNPKEAPLIDANYLAERRDLETLITGVRMGREILTGAAFLPYQDEEFQPGVAIKTDTQIEQWVRAKCETGYNPGGTCKMGPGDDPMAVVDSRCRVRGVEALRVVDASVMPTLVGGNANAPTIMIAERAAFFMKER